MISIEIAEGATLVNTSGAYWKFLPTGGERVRLVVRAPEQQQVGWLVEGSNTATCKFFTSRGKFITSGSLATQPPTKAGESILIEFENHGGLAIELQWW